MATTYKVEIDLEVLRDNFFCSTRKAWSIDAVKEWLRSEKFKELPDGRWLCEELQLDLLDRDEILSKQLT